MTADDATLYHLLQELSKEFHAILTKMGDSGQIADGIIQSISSSLDKALDRVSNDLPLTIDVKNGIDQACTVSVKLFEGSGIDYDLQKVKHLIETRTIIY